MPSPLAPMQPSAELSKIEQQFRDQGFVDLRITYKESAPHTFDSTAGTLVSVLSALEQDPGIVLNSYADSEK